MEISKKKCIWSCPLAVIDRLKVINKFVGWENPYIVWSSLLEHGLKGSQVLWSLLVTSKVT